MKATFACNSSNESLPFSLSGTVDATDSDDADAFGGYSVSVNDFKMLLDFGGAKLTFTMNGLASNTKGASSFTGKYEQAFSIVASGTGDNDGSAEIGMWVDTVVTPTSMSAVRAAGSIDSMTGFLKAKGKVESETFDVVLALSSSGLKYNNTTCPDESAANPFTEGSMSLKDGSGNELKATYTNCVEAWTFNGAAVSTLN
jgi:hypothetical protein